MNYSEEYKKLEQRKDGLTEFIVSLLNQQNDLNAKLFLARREYRDLCDQGLDEQGGELADYIVYLLNQQNDVNDRLFLARKEFRDVCDQLRELEMQEQNDSLDDEQLESTRM